jgi:hypothetical protein
VYYLNKNSLNIMPELSSNAAIDFCNLVICIHDEYLNVDRCCFQLQKLGLIGFDAYYLLDDEGKGYLTPADLERALEPYFHYLGMPY